MYLTYINSYKIKYTKYKIQIYKYTFIYIHIYIYSLTIMTTMSMTKAKVPLTGNHYIDFLKDAKAKGLQFTKEVRSLAYDEWKAVNQIVLKNPLGAQSRKATKVAQQQKDQNILSTFYASRGQPKQYPAQYKAVQGRKKTDWEDDNDD